MRYLLFFSLLFSANALFGITPHAYVTDQLGGSVRVIDISNDTVQTIFGFTGPRVVKVTADGTLAYVGCDDNTVRVIDTITNTLLPVVININHPTALALTPDGKRIYIVSLNDTVTVVQTSDYTIHAEITGFDNPRDIKVTPDGTSAYVTNAGNGTVSVISTSDNTIVDTITGFQVPIGITFAANGGFAYVTDTTHSAVYVVRVSDNTIVDVILGLNSPSYAAVTPNKNYIFVSNTGNNTISIIRASDNVIIGTIPIPVPKSLAVTQDGLYLYIGSDFGTVFKVRLLDYAILVAIPNFQNPSNIALATNNAPADSVNGCQVMLSPTDVYNQITWEAPDGNPTGYQIFRDIPLAHIVKTLGPDTLEFIDTNREPGQTYTYYVVATYANGFSCSIGSVEVGPHRVCHGL